MNGLGFFGPNSHSVTAWAGLPLTHTHTHTAAAEHDVYGHSLV